MIQKLKAFVHPVQPRLFLQEQPRVDRDAHRVVPKLRHAGDVLLAHIPAAEFVPEMRGIVLACDFGYNALNGARAIHARPSG